MMKMSTKVKIALGALALLATPATPAAAMGFGAPRFAIVVGTCPGDAGRIARMASRPSRQTRPRTAPPGDAFRAWAEMTELCLALRGSTLIGARRARSWRACVRAGLAEANRRRTQEQRG